MTDHDRGSAGLLRDDPVAYRSMVSPHKVAIHELATGREFTYAELDRQISGLAAALRARFPDLAGARIAALARNSTAEITLAMACQRVGAIFVPLNWRLAAAELQVLLADCAPLLLLCDPEFQAAALAAAPATLAVVAFDSFSDGAAAPGDAPALGPADGSVAVALLYTSGTTGVPKAVIVTRANACFAALSFALVGEIGADAVVLSDLPMFHTIGLIAVTRTTLMMGGELVVAERFDAARTLLALAARRVTHYFGVPQIAAALRAEPGYAAGMAPALRAMFMGGAPLPPALTGAFLDDGIALVNGYGMSEAGTVAHMPIDLAVIRRHADAIGLPAPFVDIRIVDATGRPAADETVGELWIRGPAVTPGYWRRPAETEAAFTAGWFRTGDLVSRSSDGLLRLAGRLKDMYISGGENVYPAEVENVLLAHPLVAEAAIVGIADSRWGESGLAFVVARSPALDGGQLDEYCRQQLARYKCPARFVFVSSLPRTASGKVQRHLLRPKS